MGRRSHRSISRPRRTALVGLAALALLGACGLEDRSGAIGPVPTSTSPTEELAEPARPGVVSVDPNWQELQLGPHVSAWLPTNSGWQLTGQGTNARGGSFVQLGQPETQLVVRAETWPGGDQSAAALCATTLADLLADAGITDITPQPSGDPAPGAQLVDAFSCRTDAVPGPGGPTDQLLTVLVRQTDQITYTQLVWRPTEPIDPAATAAAMALTEQMLARTLGRLEQR